MEFQILLLFIIVSLGFVASHNSAVTSEVYWNSFLPNTPMPKNIRDLLPSSEGMEAKSGYVGVDIGGGGGVGVDIGGQHPIDGHPGSGSVGVGVGGGVGVDIGGEHKGGSTHVDVRHGGGSVSIGKSHHGKPVHVGWNKNHSPFLYNYAANDDQLHDNPNVALFFLEKDMNPGTMMNLHFFKSSNGATFLPRQVAETIPFSSNNMIEILNRFSVQPNSMEAETIRNTINECEQPGIQGEEKLCATSLESMLDFSVSKLGKNIKPISTITGGQNKQQEYNITKVEKMNGNNIVACHQKNYTYAIFYCHKTHRSKAYTVSLLGKDGAKAKGVAVCHEDTSAWNPNHLAFKVLKVKPGSVPVCHFLPQDHIIWVPK